MYEIVIQKEIDHPLVIGPLSKLLHELRFSNITLSQAEEMLKEISALRRNLLILFLNYMMSKVGYDNMTVCLLGRKDEEIRSNDCWYGSNEVVYRYQNQRSLDHRYWIQIATLTDRRQRGFTLDDYYPFPSDEEERIPTFEKEHLKEMEFHNSFLEWNLFFMNEECEILKMKVVELSKEAFVTGEQVVEGIHIIQKGIFDESDFAKYLKATFSPESYPWIRPNKHVVFFLDKRVCELMRTLLEQSEEVLVTDPENLVNDLAISDSDIQSWVRITDELVERLNQSFRIPATTTSGQVRERLMSLKQELKKAQKELDFHGSVRSAILSAGIVIEGAIDMMYWLWVGRQGEHLSIRDKLETLHTKGRLSQELFTDLYYAWKVRSYAAHHGGKTLDRWKAETILQIAYRLLEDLEKSANHWFVKDG